MKGEYLIQCIIDGNSIEFLSRKNEYFNFHNVTNMSIFKRGMNDILHAPLTTYLNNGSVVILGTGRGGARIEFDN